MKEKKVSIGAIVIGGHVQGLGIARILGREQIPVVILDKTKHNIARFSKYCTSFYSVSNEDVLKQLESFRSQKMYEGWVIYPTNDAHVEVLSQNKQTLEPYFRITTDHWNSVSIFYDKIKTYHLAEKLGIPIAKTFYPNELSDLNAIEIEFPCIIKPAVMHSFYAQTKQKVFVCNNLAELRENYTKASGIIPALEIIVQEIIQGPSKNQFSACFLYLNQQTWVWLTACRMRQHPIDFGNATTYAETVDAPELKAFAEQILSAANYNGLCEVEFKWTAATTNTNFWRSTPAPGNGIP